MIDPDLQAFLTRIEPHSTPRQRELFTWCAALKGEQAEELLGGLLRLMFEPDQPGAADFWDVLERTLCALHTRVFDPGMTAH